MLDDVDDAMARNPRQLLPLLRVSLPLLASLLPRLHHGQLAVALFVCRRRIGKEATTPVREMSNEALVLMRTSSGTKSTLYNLTVHCPQDANAQQKMASVAVIGILRKLTPYHSVLLPQTGVAGGLVAAV